MLIDLTCGQMYTLMDFFHWGESSVSEAYIDTDKNEVIFMGAEYPSVYQMPKEWALVQVGPAVNDKWKVIKSKNFWNRNAEE